MQNPSGSTDLLPHPHPHFHTVAQALAYLRTHARAQPGLDEVAQAVGLSGPHLQRVFVQWAGVSPKRFLQFLSKERALAALRTQADVLAATDAAGLSGPGRLHDLLVNCTALTPGEIRSGGRGVVLGWGWADTPFGPALLAWTPRGLCHLAFSEPEEATHHETELRADWPQAQHQRNDEGAAQWAQRALATLQTGTESPSSASNSAPLHTPPHTPLPLLLRGTNFQIQVWQALLRVPVGTLASYSQLATAIGSPRAQRAVGSALAANRIALLIPCHRVIRESGDFGPYRWGPARKCALLGWEAAQTSPEA